MTCHGKTANQKCVLRHSCIFVKKLEAPLNLRETLTLGTHFCCVLKKQRQREREREALVVFWSCRHGQCSS